MRFYILLIFFITSFNVFSQEKQRVAIVDFFGDNLSKDELSLIKNSFTANLKNSNHFDLQAYKEIDEILKEQFKQQSDEYNDETIVELGELVGAQVLIFGYVDKIDDKIQITAQLIDVKTGTILLIKKISSDIKNIGKIELFIVKLIVNPDSEKEIYSQLVEFEKNQREKNILTNELSLDYNKNKNIITQNKAALGVLSASAGIMGLSLIGGSIGIGFFSYYLDLNKTSVTTFDILKYKNYADTTFFIGLGFFIGSGVMLIPLIIGIALFVYTNTFLKDYKNKQKKLEELEIKERDLLSFDILYRNDEIKFSFIYKF